jgi:hypothetical protein
VKIVRDICTWIYNSDNTKLILGSLNTTLISEKYKSVYIYKSSSNSVAVICDDIKNICENNVKNLEEDCVCKYDGIF